jgi:hypothetical protein
MQQRPRRVSTSSAQNPHPCKVERQIGDVYGWICCAEADLCVEKLPVVSSSSHNTEEWDEAGTCHTPCSWLVACLQRALLILSMTAHSSCAGSELPGNARDLAHTLDCHMCWCTAAQ